MYDIEDTHSPHYASYSHLILLHTAFCLYHITETALIEITNNIVVL